MSDDGSGEAQQEHPLTIWAGRPRAGEVLLSRDNVLGGTHQVSLRIRPYRLAYLLPTDSVETAAAVIDTLYRTWGGVYDFLVPCPIGGQPSPEWKSILESFDPDAIVDCAAANASLKDWSDRTDRFLHTWSDPVSNPPLIGAALYSLLEQRNPRPTLASPRLNPSDPHFLPILARIGRVQEVPFPDRSLQASIGQRRFGGWYDVQQIDVPNDPERLAQWLAEPFPVLVEDPTMLELQWLPHLGRLGLHPQEPPWSFLGSSDQTLEDRKHLHRIIVVGEATSVEDLCLFWNLRASRMVWYGFPIWLTPDLLTPPAAGDAVRAAIALMNRTMPSIGPEQVDPNSLTILSASCEAPDIEPRLRDLLPGCPCAVFTGQFDTFFGPGFQTRRSQDAVVAFTEGHGDVPTPDVSSIADWGWTERVIREFKIAGYHPPIVHSTLLVRPGPLSRIGPDGSISGLISVSPPHARLDGFYLPDAWTFLEALFARAGYRAKPSDKGTRALAVWELFDGPSGLPILKSERMIDLIREMSEIEGRQAAQQSLRALFPSFRDDEVQGGAERLIRDLGLTGQFNRQHKPFDGIGQILGLSSSASRPTAERLVSWLVERQILHRGSVLICPRCTLARWYPVDRLGSIFRCDGCNVEMPTPFRPHLLTWTYRLNELIAKAWDQGAVPHVLAIWERVEGRQPNTGLLGWHPGLELLSPHNLAPVTEIDLVGIDNGALTIGECKADGATLSETERNQIIQLAADLEARRVLFAALNGFSEAQIHADEPGPPITWLHKDELLAGDTAPAGENYLVQAVRQLDEKGNFYSGG